MNYDEIVFSKEDRVRLNENRDSICKWIEKNILPKLQKDDVIRIDFGGVYSSCRSFDTTTNYHFAVYGDPERKIRSMFDSYDGQIGFGEKFGGIGTPFDKAFSREIYVVMDNWQMIKQTLLTEVDARIKGRESIHAFQV